MIKLIDYIQEVTGLKVYTGLQTSVRGSYVYLAKHSDIFKKWASTQEVGEAASYYHRVTYSILACREGAWDAMFKLREDILCRLFEDKAFRAQDPDCSDIRNSSIVEVGTKYEERAAMTLELTYTRTVGDPAPSITEVQIAITMGGVPGTRQIVVEE